MLGVIFCAVTYGKLSLGGPMGKIGEERIASARKAANEANRLGDLIYGVAQGFFVVLTFGVIVGMFAIYIANRADDGFGSTTDWNIVLPGWGLLLAAWMLYSFGLAMIALVGAIARAKAESLEIQIAQVQGQS